MSTINVNSLAGFSVTHVATEENKQAYLSSAFICVDGSTALLANICDGTPHCPDSSDEVASLCRHVV